MFIYFPLFPSPMFHTFHPSFIPCSIQPFSPIFKPQVQHTTANYDCLVFLTIFINMNKIIRIPFYLAVGFMVLAMSPILLIKSIIQ